MPDKRAQIADALASMGYSRKGADAAAEKLDDLSRPLSDLLRDGLAYARGESPKTDTKIATKDRGSKDKVKDKDGKRDGWRRRVADLRAFVADHKVGSALAGGVLAGGLLAVLAGRVGRAANPTAAGADPKAIPPPPPPGSATAHAGATLTVRTPKGKAQPGVLRKAAGLSSPMLATVADGTAVTVVESATADRPPKRWYRVQTPQGLGWMHGDILKGEGA